MVEVDADTGEVKLERYVAVDDVGNVINPLIVDGQIQGGIAQGVAQALWEAAAYDENGQLLSLEPDGVRGPEGRLLPAHRARPDGDARPTVNPLGIKGVGETGTIASTRGGRERRVDALAPLGIRHVDMPLTPERVWRAMQEARS